MTVYRQTCAINDERRPPRESKYLLVAALSLFATGCSDAAPPETAVHPARGSALFRGKPISGGAIYLHPVLSASQAVPKPHARVAPDGTFQLSTYREHDGAPPGEYAVTVSWRVPANKQSADELKEEDWDQGREQLPARYQDPQKSGLRVTIQPGQNELPPLRLSG